MSFCIFSEPHSSVGSVADLGTSGRLFDPRLMTDDSHRDKIHSSLIAVRCFDNGNVGKQPVVWKEYCGALVKKELQESIDRCTGRCDVTEILLKKALNTKQSNNQSVNAFCIFKDRSPF